jgi:peptide/nickel transport system substrate-binding protein
MQRLRYLFFSLLFSLASLGLAQTLTIAQGVDATTLDPNDQEETPTQNIVANIFDPLLWRDADGSIQPWLATSVEPVDDLTWEITLRDDVTFHDGEPLTAEVVAWNFERALDEETPIRFLSNFTPVTGVEVTGEHTLEVTTETPYPVFETHLTRFFIVSQSNYEANGAAAAAENPVGTGPYRFVSWQRDQRLELEAFPEYWQGPASIPNVVFRPIPEDSTRVSELVTGGVNIATNVLPEAVPLIESSGAAEIRTVDSIRNIFIVFTATDEGPLADPRVRRALNLGVNVDAIIGSVFGGNATPTATPLNNYMFGYAEDLDNRQYDPEQAQQLLAEAGYEGGFSFTMGSPSGRYLNDRLVAEAVVGQLAEIGVQVELQVQEWSSYVGQILERQVPTDAYLIGWGNSNYDADRTLFTMLYGGTAPGGPDQAVFSYFQNDEYDQLILQARETLDEDERLELYRRAQEIVVAEAPWLFLYQQGDVYGVSTNLNWEPLANELIWAYSASFE